MTTTSISLIPPGSGGIRDYASAVGPMIGAPVLELTRDTDPDRLGGDFLYLHFSGYGYQKRGVPFWLGQKIAQLRSHFRAFGVVFHELFASGPPWGSAFWLSGFQRRIARDMVLQADFWLTNRDAAAQWLRGQPKAVPNRVLPVFSNVGEPSPVSTEGREPGVVVFGSAGIRAMVYQWNRGEIFGWARHHGLRIHDVGAPMTDASLARSLQDEGVEQHGKLPADAVSQLMSRMRYGAVAYPTDYVCKSGVFAAYSAHALCPVLLAGDYTSYDGLQAGVHYLPGFDAAGDAAAVAAAAHAWYEPHSIAAHAAALQALSSGQSHRTSP